MDQRKRLIDYDIIGGELKGKYFRNTLATHTVYQITGPISFAEFPRTDVATVGVEFLWWPDSKLRRDAQSYAFSEIKNHVEVTAEELKSFTEGQEIVVDKETDRKHRFGHLEAITQAQAA